MIEKGALIEQEHGMAVLVWVSTDGRLEWLMGGDADLRGMVEQWELAPYIKHYRVSGDRIHSTPGEPRYFATVKDLLEAGKAMA